MNRNKKDANVKIRKTLVRNFEVKVAKKNSVSHKTVSEPCTSNTVKRNIVPPKIEFDRCASKSPKSILKNNNENVFAKPQLNTIKKLTKTIEQINKTDPKPYLEPTDADLAAVNRKVGSKLNFHINETVYKELVALNIGEFSSKTRAHQRSTIPSINRDITPNLDDFYENQPVKDKPIIVSIPNIKTSTIAGYDGTEIFRKFKSWELQ